MKAHLTESIEIPEGVSCTFADNTLRCKKGADEIARRIAIPNISVKVESNKVIFDCPRGNKKDYKIIKSNIAHMKNVFTGLQEKYVYHLESCNVHFPMTMKVDGNKFVISNFLGEKTPRIAKIVSGVSVEVKGAKITVTSHNKEAAGQTAANLEKATKIRNRDRRIFQDGIYLVDRPGGAK